MVTKTLLVGLLVLGGGVACQKQADWKPAIELQITGPLDDDVGEVTGIVGQTYEMTVLLIETIDQEGCVDDCATRSENKVMLLDDVSATCSPACTVASIGYSESEVVDNAITLGIVGLEPGPQELHVEVRYGAEDVYEATLPLRFAAVDSLTVMYDSHTGPGATHAVLPGTRVEWCAVLFSVDGEGLVVPDDPRTHVVAGFGEATQPHGCAVLIPEAPGTTTFTASYGDLHASHDLHVASAETAQDVVIWQVPDTVTSVHEWVFVEDDPLVGAQAIQSAELEVGTGVEYIAQWVLADGGTVLGGFSDLVVYPESVVELQPWALDEQPPDVRWLFRLKGLSPGAATLSLNKGDISLSVPIVVREAAP